MDVLKFIELKLFSSEVLMLFFSAELKTLYFVIICSAEDLFTLNSNKFRMVYNVDGNLQLDSHDWSMYSNILKSKFHQYFIFTRILQQFVPFCIILIFTYCLFVEKKVGED